MRANFKVAASFSRQLQGLRLFKCGWMGLFDHLLSRCVAPRLMCYYIQSNYVKTETKIYYISIHLAQQGPFPRCCIYHQTFWFSVWILVRQTRLILGVCGYEVWQQTAPAPQCPRWAPPSLSTPSICDGSSPAGSLRQGSQPSLPWKVVVTWDHPAVAQHTDGYSVSYSYWVMSVAATVLFLFCLCSYVNIRVYAYPVMVPCWIITFILYDLFWLSFPLVWGLTLYLIVSLCIQ